MSLGVARPLALYTRVFDCLDPVTPSTAMALARAGYGAAARYLENLTDVERDGLWSAGLPILPLSEMPIGPLSEVVGEQHGLRTNELAARLGVAERVHIMTDLEATPTGATAEAVIGYVDARTSVIESARRPSLLYTGAAQPLSGQVLYMLPHVHLYWRGGSVGIPEPPVSFAIWQVPPLDQTIEGHRIDTSMTGRDGRGRLPVAWWPA